VELIVTARTPVATDVIELTLMASDRKSLPPWNPGAHIELELPGGISRQYSLCGPSAQDDEWRIAVLREEGGKGGSRYLHDAVAVGDTLKVRSLRNNFRLQASERYHFIASGIGITPILAMVEKCESLNLDLRLHYIGRQREQLAYLDRLPSGNTSVHITAETGRPDLAAILPPLDGEETWPVYACGSPALLSALEAALDVHPTSMLHTEWFAPRPVKAAADALEEFDVVLERSGVTVRVEPDQSILTASAEAGVYIPSSCEQGTCGSCEVVLLKGLVDHRDSVLDEEERQAGQILMPCVSRARSEVLVLDA
jgi:ferredoxin-NADP reductase